MGILTNPNMDDTNRFVKFLQGKGGVLGLLCYVAGIAWLVFLANAEYNLGGTNVFNDVILMSSKLLYAFN